MGLFVVFGAWVAVPNARTDRDGPEPPNVPVAAVTRNGPGVVPNLERDEQEAKILFERARDFGKAGKTDVAVERLTKITTKYKTTKVAIERDRRWNVRSKDCHCSGQRCAVVKSAGGDCAAPVSGPKVVVDASQTNVSAVANAPANLVLPRNQAEPSAERPHPVRRPFPRSHRSRCRPALVRAGGATCIHQVGRLRSSASAMSPRWCWFLAVRSFKGEIDADPNEGPEHKVTLGTYYIDKHEVTVRQFNLFEKETKKRFERTRALNRDPALRRSTRKSTRRS